MAEGERIGLAARQERRRIRPFAHWVAVGAAVVFVALGEIGNQIADAATYPVCTGSTPAVPGGNLLLIAVFILAPSAIIAGVVSLVRGPRRLVSVLTSVGSIIVVLVLFWHYWLEMVDWGMGCGY
jgi:hypothetical protein